MMFLPQSTYFNKRIPKQKFYENIPIPLELKRVFVGQIKSIYWQNKIAPETVNLPAGQSVQEVEVLAIQVNQPSLPETVFYQIDKSIPYHILFLLKYEDKAQAWIGYKEASCSEKNAFKVNTYYHTEWMREEQLQLRLDGLDLDTVYENFVRQIAGGRLQIDVSLQEAVEQDKRQEKLEKELIQLKKKLENEKQPTKRFEIFQKIKELESAKSILL